MLRRIPRPNADSVLKSTLTDSWCNREGAACTFAISIEISGLCGTNWSIRAEQANRVRRFDVIADSSLSYINLDTELLPTGP